MLAVTPDLALAMSRYLVFAGVALTLARVVVESWQQARSGCPLPRLAFRRLAYIPLVGVLAYYARALFWPGVPTPTAWDLTVINTLLGAFFIFQAWPRRSRVTDPDRTGWR